MDVIFATKNPAKVKRYYDKLKEKGINLIVDKDLEVKVEENGKNGIENACIKAKGYFDKTNTISLGIDDSLFLDNVPEDKQPGVYVRRIDKKNAASDKDTLDYYINLVKQYGIDGKLDAKWVYGVAIYDGEKYYTQSFSKQGFYLVEIPCSTINTGYPLNSISIDKKSGKYFAEQTEEEKKQTGDNYVDDDVTQFILNTVLKDKKLEGEEYVK